MKHSNTTTRTQSQRIQCFTKVRKVEGDISKIDDRVLEREKKNTFDENIRNLIKTLLRKDPSKRPSAKELLTSDLVLGRLELNKPFMREALRAVKNPRSASHKILLKEFYGNFLPTHTLCVHKPLRFQR